MEGQHSGLEKSAGAQIEHTGKEYEHSGAVNYQDLSVDNLVSLADEFEAFEGEKEKGESGFGIVKNGQFNKERFAAVMQYGAPRRLLFSSAKSGAEAIAFLRSLNTELHNDTLAGTTDYLESQLPYLEAAGEISKEAMEKMKEVWATAETMDWLRDAEAKTDALHRASHANLLRTEAGVFFTNLVNKTYSALWKEYLVPKEALQKELAK